MYEGIRSVYQEALKIEKKFKERAKNDPQVENPGILKIFQLCLKDIPVLNQHEIETETNRIKEKSKCSEWFDQLIKAVIKSHIVLLTYNASGKTCKTVKEKHHETIDIKLFIHKCYIECARIFYNYPELFWHQYSTLDIKRNQREAHDLIKVAIKEAITKMIPMNLVLQEYLSNDYMRDIEENVGENISESQYMNLKSMVHRDLSQDHVVNVFDDGSGKHSLIVETTDDLSDEDEEFEKELENATKNRDAINLVKVPKENPPNNPHNGPDSEPNNELNNELNNEPKNEPNIENSKQPLKPNNIIYVDPPKNKGKPDEFFKNVITVVGDKNQSNIGEPIIRTKNQNKQQSKSQSKIFLQNKSSNTQLDKQNENKHIDSNDLNINVIRSVKGSDIGAFFEDYLEN
jgi:hypothetical protein